MTRYRIAVVNGVFVSEGMGENGHIRPPRLFTALAEQLTAETGMDARAIWPYGTQAVFGIPAFLILTRRRLETYARHLAERIREDVRAKPLAPGESLAFVAYSGGVPVVQMAAHLLRPALPVASFVFFGPALLPGKVRGDWAGEASVGCILGARDWIQGVYPRVPRPWPAALHAATRARIVAALPTSTRYATLPCDHWPGYFTPAVWPLLVGAIGDLLPPPEMQQGGRGRPSLSRS